MRCSRPAWRIGEGFGCAFRLNAGLSGANLVSMASFMQRKKPTPGRWLLQDAKARFSELVRLVRSEGPQLVTVHGRDEVVAAGEFRRLKGDRMGDVLIAALQASPHRDIEITAPRTAMPVRSVEL